MNTSDSIFFAAPRRVHRKRKDAARTSPVPGVLTLVAASYEASAFVELTFDRPVDIAGIDVETITVDDGNTGYRYRGLGTAELTSPTTVYVPLEGLEELPFTGVHLNATAANGIVAVGDGAEWAGVSELELPFP